MVVDKFFSISKDIRKKVERKREKKTGSTGKGFQKKYLAYQNFNTEEKITEVSQELLNFLRKYY